MEKRTALLVCIWSWLPFLLLVHSSYGHPLHKTAASHPLRGALYTKEDPERYRRRGPNFSKAPYGSASIATNHYQGKDDSKHEPSTHVHHGPGRGYGKGHDHDHGLGKSNYKKGYNSGFHKGHGYKGKKGFKDTEGYKKKNHGHFGKTKHNGYFDKGGKKYKGHKHKNKYFGDIYKAHKGKKGHDIGNKGHHNKGNKDKGFKNVYHKEEYHHSKKFYNDFDNKKHNNKYDDFDSFTKGVKANDYKGGHYKGGFHNDNYGAKGENQHAKYHDNDSKHKDTYGHKGYYGADHKEGHKQGQQGGDSRHHGHGSHDNDHDHSHPHSSHLAFVHSPQDHAHGWDAHELDLLGTQGSGGHNSDDAAIAFEDPPRYEVPHSNRPNILSENLYSHESPESDYPNTNPYKHPANIFQDKPAYQVNHKPTTAYHNNKQKYPHKNNPTNVYIPKPKHQVKKKPNNLVYLTQPEYHISKPRNFSNSSTVYHSKTDFKPSNFSSISLTDNKFKNLDPLLIKNNYGFRSPSNRLNKRPWGQLVFTMPKYQPKINNNKTSTPITYISLTDENIHSKQKLSPYSKYSYIRERPNPGYHSEKMRENQMQFNTDDKLHVNHAEQDDERYSNLLKTPHYPLNKIVSQTKYPDSIQTLIQQAELDQEDKESPIYDDDNDEDDDKPQVQKHDFTSTFRELVPQPNFDTFGDFAKFPLVAN